MKKRDWVDIIFKHKIFIITFVALVFIATGILLTSLKMNNDMTSFISQDDPDIKLLNYTGEKFGSNYINLIALEMDDVFTYDNLSLINKITEKLEALDGVDQVISITNVLDVKKLEDGLEVSRLLDGNKIPSDKKALENLKTYVTSKDLFKGSIVNKAGNTSLLMVRLRTSTDKEKVASATEKLINKEIAGKENIKAYYTGMPMWMYFANKLLLKDISFLMPLVALLIITTLIISFHSLHGVVLPFTTVTIASVGALGLMAVFNMPLTLLSSIVPVLLLSNGTAYSIHLLNRENELMAEGVKEPKERIKLAFNRVGIAIFLSAATTIFGFGSLVTANLIPIRQFGIVLGIGIFFALAITFTLTPIFLVFWRKKMHLKRIKAQIAEERKVTIGEKFLKLVAKFVYIHPKYFISVAGAVVLLSIIFIPRIKTEVNLSKYFPPSNPVSKADHILEKEFNGSNPIVVYLKTKNIKSPAVLKAIQRIQKKMRSINHIGNPQAVTDYIMEMNYIINDQRTVPATFEGVENLWLFIDGKKELKSMMGDDKQEALIQGMADNGSSAVTQPMAKALDDYLKSFPKEFAGVEVSNLDDPKKDKVYFAYSSFLAEEMSYDLDCIGVKNADTGKLASLLLTMAHQPAIPDENKKESIARYFSAYLSSDTSEIFFEDPRAIESINSAVWAMPSWNKDKVKKVILKWTPRDILKDDPAAVDDLVDSLGSKWILAQQDAAVKAAMKELEKTFGFSADNIDSVAKERIIGDLWQMYDTEIWLPAAVYENVMGTKPNDVVGIDLKQTGQVKMMLNVLNQLTNSLFQSLFIALGLVYLLLSVQFRSFYGGLISIAPIALTILCNFTVMGIFNLPLDVATMMIASISIGIGIDYTIHIKTRFRKELVDMGNIQKALTRTITTTGKAVMINTIAVMMGFIVLAFSEFQPIRLFGFLMSIIMIISAWAAVTVFPALVIVLKPKFLFKNHGLKK